MRFEFIAGALCLEFANTVHNVRAEDKGEELHAIADLLQWAKEAGLLSSADHDRVAAHYNRNPRKAAAALAKGTAIRDLLFSIFAGIAHGRPVSSRRLSELNSAMAQAPGRLRVHKSADRIETAWTSAVDGLQQALFAVLASAAELLASDRVGRIRQCASADCTWLFVDESRNRSRRWCDMSVCGNRMKARRHYQRAKAAQ
ncbi:MAG: CGNR zinc finger domain-containing protein [Acidobacteria bacterium]|nr:CGNR zinc finger domain-containing protein [Acidobacteriota bacterium]